MNSFGINDNEQSQELLSEFANYRAMHRWPAYSSLKELSKMHIYSKDLCTLYSDIESGKIDISKLIEPERTIPYMSTTPTINEQNMTYSQLERLKLVFVLIQKQDITPDQRLIVSK